MGTLASFESLSSLRQYSPYREPRPLADKAWRIEMISFVFCAVYIRYSFFNYLSPSPVPERARQVRQWLYPW